MYNLDKQSFEPVGTIGYAEVRRHLACLIFGSNDRHHPLVLRSKCEYIAYFCYSEGVLALATVSVLMTHHDPKQNVDHTLE